MCDQRNKINWGQPLSDGDTEVDFILYMFYVIVFDGISRKTQNIDPILISRVNINPCPAKVIYLNFQPLKVVSRYRDPQL